MTTNEGCDDHNLINGDGCSSTCIVETGYLCTFSIPTYSVCKAICGDGLKMPSETCDDGNIDNTSKCKADCSGAVAGWTCIGGDSLSASNCNTNCGDSISLGLE